MVGGTVVYLAGLAYWSRSNQTGYTQVTENKTVPPPLARDPQGGYSVFTGYFSSFFNRQPTLKQEL